MNETEERWQTPLERETLFLESVERAERAERAERERERAERAERAPTHDLSVGDVMRSTQYYGQTRRFSIVKVTPKTVSVKEIRRWGFEAAQTKRVREDGTFSLGRWQLAYKECPEKFAAGEYPSDFHW